MSYLFKLKEINTFVFDVDGVFTNNTILCGEGGEMLRNMNVIDGLAIKKALEKKYTIVIITGGGDLGVKKRLQYLGVQHIFDKTFEKADCLLKFSKENKIDLSNVLYIGDDLPDLKAMEICGLKCCPKNAVTQVKKIADYISPKNGGEGIVREMIEKVMKIQGTWD
ncbi:MAG: HAD hydrolase family protein [Bacteroidetes bacterium]|jgi:3-deoxy-D-manno-octulosonate 8-phosphate phosphatase (KDO 8-P phosphatase)|nr:HAD hydrolase family protein [Bacteroidota bacterium]MBL0079526.1 HAD hydrolase family protein [Bacteroidota bacterium]